MKKNRVDTEGRSWNTFFIYAVLVVLVVFISLTIKALFVLQKSKFDGRLHFILAISKEGRVQEVIAFDPPSQSLSLLKLKDSTLGLSSVGKTLGVASDGTIEARGHFPVGDDVGETLMASFFQFGSIKTNLTLLDIGQLFMLNKSIAPDKRIVKELALSHESDADEIIASFFGDSAISSEGVNIQIINASDIPGMGKRFERVVSNLGGSVVSVSTAHKKEPLSQIQYTGTETYTLKKIAGLFGFPVSIQDKKGTPGMVITIGEDSKKTSLF